MSAINVISATVDLAKGIQMVRLGRLFAANDKAAHTINVRVLDDGKVADLTGQTISAYFIRPDNATVTISGTLTDNVASVTLPSSCYANSGHFSIIIKAVSTDVTTAIFWGDGTITRSTTDTIVDPENIIPSLEELLAQISTMQTATAAANMAAGTANTAAGNADTKAGLADTAAATANAAAAKIDNMTVSASGLAAGQSPTATITEVSGHKHIAFAIPKGDKGEKGEKGDPGSIDNVSAETIPMSATDSTTVAQAIAAAGKVETVAGVGVAAGTKNVPLKGSDLPMSASDPTTVAEAIEAAGKVETVAGVGVATGTKNVPLTGADIPLSSSDSTKISSKLGDIDDSIATKADIPGWYNMGTISSLPVTKLAGGVTTDMICTHSQLGTPSAQTSDWTVDTDTEGQITISGSISGSTTLYIKLEKVRTVTPT